MTSHREGNDSAVPPIDTVCKESYDVVMPPNHTSMYKVFMSTESVLEE